MLRYIFYVAAVFLIADHLFTHWGPEIINWLASRFLGREITVVKEAPYRESLIDRAVQGVRDRLGDRR